MSDHLAQRIRSLEAQLNKLKSGTLKSSSSLGISEQIITIPSGLTKCKIIIRMPELALWTSYLVSPTDLTGLEIEFRCTTDENHNNVVYIEMISGAANLNGFKVSVRATSIFSYQIT